jgi:hypothetical protein
MAEAAAVVLGRGEVRRGDASSLGGSSLKRLLGCAELALRSAGTAELTRGSCVGRALCSRARGAAAVNWLEARRVLPLGAPAAAGDEEVCGSSSSSSRFNCSACATVSPPSFSISAASTDTAACTRYPGYDRGNASTEEGHGVAASPGAGTTVNPRVVVPWQPSCAQERTHPSRAAPLIQAVVPPLSRIRAVVQALSAPVRRACGCTRLLGVRAMHAHRLTHASNSHELSTLHDRSSFTRTGRRALKPFRKQCSAPTTPWYVRC